MSWKLGIIWQKPVTRHEYCIYLNTLYISINNALTVKNGASILGLQQEKFLERYNSAVYNIFR